VFEIEVKTVGVFDVQASALIRAISADLKRQGLKQPEWSLFVKTGAHAERAPDSKDWFFERMASILYRIYKEGPLGTGSLRTYYGGKKRRGTKRPEFRKSSGKIIRVCLQGLEKQGLVKKAKKGRVVTAKGQAYLNQMAKEAVGIAKQAVEERAKAGAEKEKHEEKSADEKSVEAALRKQDQAERQKEKAKEDAKKKEKQHGEKKPEEAAA
jgi:small subunit ribosomal protein S19e